MAQSAASNQHAGSLCWASNAGDTTLTMPACSFMESGRCFAPLPLHFAVALGLVAASSEPAPPWPPLPPVP
eukprot:11711107-Alexandrium_andersonii.AAC.1